ncbi:MAG: 4'-phosphopantetheinyl transferase family protein [Solirubrobacteraceae bacterium]
MDAGWLSRSHAEIPSGEDWLGAGERRALARLVVDKRRADWLLGRFTAKAALAAWLNTAPACPEILAADDGAPEAWLDGIRLPVSLSISHRDGRAMAAVAARPGVVGCDLELLEPRSAAFIREWLAQSEQRALESCDEAQRMVLANLFWAAKEATAKVLRLGLALNVRRAVVSITPEDGPWAALDDASRPPDAWRALRIDWSDGSNPPCLGWWRAEQRWVMVIAGRPAPAVPRELY